MRKVGETIRIAARSLGLYPARFALSNQPSAPYTIENSKDKLVLRVECFRPVLAERKSTLHFRLLFSYTPPCAQSPRNPAMRLHHLLQEVRREHSGTGWDYAGYVDCRAVSALRREEELSSFRDFSREALAQTWSEDCAISGALMGEMKRAIAREQAASSQNMQDEKRMKSTLAIAAAIIAAVRLARDTDISRPSPRLTAVVNESVSLARMILDRVGR